MLTHAHRRFWSLLSLVFALALTAGPAALAAPGDPPILTRPIIGVTTSTGTSVANNSTVNVGSTAANTALDTTFYVANNGGDGSVLSISSVSVTGAWTLVAAPASSIFSGESSPLTVRLLSGSPGAKTGQITINHNGLANNPFVINLSGTVTGSITRVVACSGATIARDGLYVFPDSPAGQTASCTFRIFNDGNAPLNISNFSVSGGGFSSGQNPPASIAAGSSGTFVVQVWSRAGTTSGTVSWNSNDPANSFFRFNVRARLLGSRLRVMDNAGNEVRNGDLSIFPDTVRGTPVSRLYTVYNDGNQDLTISIPSVTGEGFSLIVTPATTIPPGGNTVFRVRMLSATAGQKNGQVAFTSNDPTRLSFSFAVRGVVN